VSQLDQLLYGIREVESGGVSGDRYRVVNSIGAVGAYQMMKQYIPAWAKEALGKTMTWQQVRDSSSAQDAIARYRLGKLLKQYNSWEKAAAVWFSGQPNPDSKASDGGNTVRQYVDKVGAAMGKGSIGAGGSGPVSTMPTLGRSVFTAQQAGYEAETKTGAYGAPVNPFKLPGWIASQGGGSTAAAGDDVVQAGFEQSGLFGGGGVSMPWDGVSTVVLSSVFVLGGVALVVVGLLSAASPIAEKAASFTPAGKLATAAKAAT
jgi:hypothetical protein